MDAIDINNYYAVYAMFSVMQRHADMYARLIWSLPCVQSAVTS